MLFGIFYRRAVPRDRPAEIALGLFACAMLLVLAVVPPSHRHAVQLIGPLLGFAAAGVCEAAALSGARLNINAAKRRDAAVVAIVMIMLCAFYLAETLKPRGIEHIALRRAGTYLFEKKRGAKILTPESPVVFYAAGERILDPARDEFDRRGVFTRFAERLERGIAAGAEYLVLEMGALGAAGRERNGRVTPEAAAAALDAIKSDARLLPEVFFQPHPWFDKGDEVRIYRIVR